MHEAYSNQARLGPANVNLGDLMRFIASMACCIGCSLPLAVGAQDSLVGTYNASYASTGIQSTLQSLTIVIASVEDGRVKGTGVRHDKACGGEYPLEGSLKGDAIRLRATKKGGPAGDCSFGFAGKVEGGAMVGKYGPHEVKFSK
jgi:hypothetical protein